MKSNPNPNKVPRYPICPNIFRMLKYPALLSPSETITFIQFFAIRFREWPQSQRSDIGIPSTLGSYTQIFICPPDACIGGNRETRRRGRGRKGGSDLQERGRDESIRNNMEKRRNHAAGCKIQNPSPFAVLNKRSFKESYLTNFADSIASSVEKSFDVELSARNYDIPRFNLTFMILQDALLTFLEYLDTSFEAYRIPTLHSY